MAHYWQIFAKKYAGIARNDVNNSLEIQTCHSTKNRPRFGIYDTYFDKADADGKIFFVVKIRFFKYFCLAHILVAM